MCGSCFSDEGLRAFCTQYASSDECDFCGATDTELIAAPLDDVIEHISVCVHNHYDDPANAGLPYESAEGGYQGPLYETYEVFEALSLEFPRDEDGKLRAAIERGLENDLWTDVDPLGLSADEKLHFSWDQFCRIIKHERRFFFLDRGEAPTPRSGDELYGPAEILKVIFSFAESEGAIVELPAGTHLYRARHQPTGMTYATAKTLGPPPLEHAIKTNRMSPPGVVMTYASEDRETALAETSDEAGTFAVGEFVTERAALILDLTRLPAVPSVFSELPDTYEYDPRPRLNFLNHVSREISKPIARDDRVHVEYVPTQVVTEYVRSAISINGRPIEGIRYASSRSSAKTALVLFADQENLVLDESERPELYFLSDRWVRLLTSSCAQVTSRDIARWAAKPRRDLFDGSQ